jgi:hypothetical protein
MKPRKFTRKLVLNKKTIANLSDNYMRYVNAGGPGPPTEATKTEYTCEITCTLVTCGGATCVNTCYSCDPGCCTQGTSAGGVCC